MAVVAARRSVTSTASRLDQGHSVGELLLTNRGTAAIYLGPSGVATSDGYQLDAGASVSIDLGPRDTLYGIAASGTHVVHVLAVKR